MRIRMLAQAIRPLLGVLLLTLCATAAAQTTLPANPQQVTRWQEVLKNAETILANNAATASVIEATRESVQSIRREISAALDPTDAAVSRLKALLTELGPQPKAAEDRNPQVERQRAQLQETLTAAEARQKSLQVLQKRADQLIGRLTTRRNEVVAARLLAYGPSLWSGDTWRSAAESGVRIGFLFAAAPGRWWDSTAVVAWRGGAQAWIFLGLMMLAGFLAVVAGRQVHRRLGANPALDDPSGVRRYGAVIATLVTQAVLPCALIGVGLLLLRRDGLLTGVLGDVLVAAAAAAVWYLVVRAGARAALRPRLPDWRLPRLTAASTKRIYVLVTAIAAVGAIDIFMHLASRSIYEPRSFHIAWQFFVFGGQSVLLFLLAARSNWLPPPAGAEHAGTARPSRPLRRTLRYVARIFALSAIGAMLLGYHRLAEFLIEGAIASAAVLGAAWLLRRIYGGLIAFLTSREYRLAQGGQFAAEIGASEAPALRFWLMLVFDLLLLSGVVAALLTIWAFDLAAVGDFAERAWTGIRIGDYELSLADILLAVGVFALLVTMVRMVQAQFEARISSQTRMDVGVRRALRAGIGYTGIIIAAAVAISLAGFDLSSLALIAGALSVGIGFGLQAIVSNFVSGIILLAERPVKEGDWIIVDKFEGFVHRIGVRATEIRTFQRASVIVPNSKLISEPVTNWLHKDLSGRIEVPVGVAYGSDVEKVREILLEVGRNHPKALKDPAPKVFFVAFGESSLNFVLWIYLESILDRYATVSDLHFAIDKAFREHGISIPFPQRDLHVRAWPPAADGPGLPGGHRPEPQGPGGTGPE